MKVLALNSSPRGGGQSKTEMMLDHLVEGMREAGAEVEVVTLRKKRIKDCVGCFTCWTKTPGQCIQKDDMTNELLPKLLQADLAVYATPLYYHSMNAIMSRFVERTLPAMMPFFEQTDRRTYHPLRQRMPKAVWLSVCGFPEDSEFDMLSALLHYIYDREGLELVAEIYRPQAESAMTRMGEGVVNDITEATRAAGRELVASLRVSPETMARITQPVADRSTFAAIGNLAWKTCIAEGVTMKEAQEKEIVPRPDSVETFMLLMPYGINKEAAADGQAILQFHFSGEADGSCYFTVRKEGVEAAQGVASSPDVTVEAPFEVWMDIMTRKADGQQMLMEGKYRVEGDLLLMMKLFERPG